jgi:hypothetical protein
MERPGACAGYQGCLQILREPMQAAKCCEVTCTSPLTCLIPASTAHRPLLHPLLAPSHPHTHNVGRGSIPQPAEALPAEAGGGQGQPRSPRRCARAGSPAAAEGAREGQAASQAATNCSHTASPAAARLRPSAPGNNASSTRGSWMGASGDAMRASGLPPPALTHNAHPK